MHSLETRGYDMDRGDAPDDDDLFCERCGHVLTFEDAVYTVSWADGHEVICPACAGAAMDTTDAERHRERMDARGWV